MTAIYKHVDTYNPKSQRCRRCLSRSPLESEVRGEQLLRNKCGLSYLIFGGTPSLSGRLNVPEDLDKLPKESNLNSREDHTAPL